MIYATIARTDPAIAEVRVVPSLPHSALTTIPTLAITYRLKGPESRRSSAAAGSPSSTRCNAEARSELRTWIERKKRGLRGGYNSKARSATEGVHEDASGRGGRVYVLGGAYFPGSSCLHCVPRASTYTTRSLQPHHNGVQARGPLRFVWAAGESSDIRHVSASPLDLNESTT
ncbi:hypothetical protein DAEQUDRAFT_432557 [Daedalea quercina L-15889]|uniref:Uncharacterized protein n=1 Tax=Daedalea quercina L-15889 TaxID=1314783 RepID=A0A165NGI2_9APHY|nr:hypothetical protein DAEQUDRAFT_432557 [Daedalea quercina L-15889]